MIVFSELQMQGGKHVEVNSGLLQCFKILYPEESFIVSADDKHYDLITGRLTDQDNITPFLNFGYDTTENKIKNTVGKTIRQTRLAYQIFKEAKKNQARFIVFTSVFPFCAFFLNVFAKHFKQKIIVCQHGDLGVLLLKKDRLTTKIFRQKIKSFLQDRNTTYNTFLFYGESIKNRLYNLYPHFPNNNVIAIDHPYYYKNKGREINNNRPLQITIANIGAALKSKNSHFLFNIAKKLSHQVEGNRLKFMQVGSISVEVLPYVNQYVSVLAKDADFIAPEVFDNALEQADYFIYFFENNSYYDLCPSGTFFDAIKHEVPIISLRNAFFDYYFEKLGNIGYLCNSVDEMETLINEIIDGKKPGDYAEQVKNLHNAKQLLSVEKIAGELKIQIAANKIDN